MKFREEDDMKIFSIKKDRLFNGISALYKYWNANNSIESQIMKEISLIGGLREYNNGKVSVFTTEDNPVVVESVSLSNSKVRTISVDHNNVVLSVPDVNKSVRDLWVDSVTLLIHALDNVAYKISDENFFFYFDIKRLLIEGKIDESIRT